MQVGILGSPTSWYLQDLQRAAARAHHLVPLPFSRLQCQLDPSAKMRLYAGETDLARFDCLLVRSMPPGSLEQIVFRMDALRQWQASGKPVVNAPRAMEVAVDKYLALAKLQAAGLTVPSTMVCQSVEDGMQAFERLGGDVVIKPLFGSEGRGMTRVSDEGLADRALRMLAQLGAVVYMQRFIPHEGHDLRLLVIGSQVLGVRRCNALDWRTNVSRGAKAEPLPVDSALQQMARRAADAVGAALAGVDVLPGKDGQLYTLEVNAVPGWRAVAEALKTDVAALILQYLESVVAQTDGK